MLIWVTAVVSGSRLHVTQCTGLWVCVHVLIWSNNLYYLPLNKCWFCYFLLPFIKHKSDSTDTFFFSFPVLSWEIPPGTQKAMSFMLPAAWEVCFWNKQNKELKGWEWKKGGKPTEKCRAKAPAVSNDQFSAGDVAKIIKSKGGLCALPLKLKQ